MPSHGKKSKTKQNLSFPIFPKDSKNLKNPENEACQAIAHLTEWLCNS